MAEVSSALRSQDAAIDPGVCQCLQQAWRYGASISTQGYYGLLSARILNLHDLLRWVLHEKI